MQACSPNFVADADSLEQIQWLAWKVSADCHMRNDYVVWVYMPYAGVAYVKTS